MLLKVLYKQLNELLDRNAIVLDKTQHSNLTLDKILNIVKDRATYKEDGATILITCQMMKKALRGLGLYTSNKMSTDESTYIKLIQNKILQKFAQTYRDTIKQLYYNDVIT